MPATVKLQVYLLEHNFCANQLAHLHLTNRTAQTNVGPDLSGNQGLTVAQNLNLST